MKTMKCILVSCIISVQLLGMGSETIMAAPAYEDPQGRFSMPLIGEWTPVDTDNADALFEIPGLNLQMAVLTIASDDLETAGAAALKQVGIDPETLTQTDSMTFGAWSIIFYEQGEGQGVTMLVQVKNDTSYCLVFTGDVGLTQNPPDHVMKTIQAFTLAGEEFVPPSTVDGFEAYVNSFVGENPPGLSVMIALNGETLYAKGFGLADGPNGMAAAPDTVFAWGSMTKMVTATALMQVVEQGLVDLDAPVSDYLDYVPAEYGITVRHLLTHSAGLGEPFEFITANLSLDGQPLPDPDLVAKLYIKRSPDLMFEPGSASSYSNPGFMLLGQIVAEISGHPYIEYVREHILKPLGMPNTDFTYSSTAMIEKAAAGAFPASQSEDLTSQLEYTWSAVSGDELIRDVDDRHAWMNRYNVLAAHGGLVGPATEAMRFAQMHLNGGELDGVRILSPESVAVMQEMQHATGGAPLGFGLAWFVFGDGEHPYIEHDGGVEQSITIRGKDAGNPVLLILHGGPGVPSSPWASWNDMYAELEAHFVVVHWDQRGAGKSFSEELTPEDMRLEHFVNDTLELTEMLRQHFTQEKIFLWGHSWGSGLGFEVLKVNAEPYHAFIASAVRPDWNATEIMGYEWVLEQARQAQDTEAIQALESIRPFDPTDREHLNLRGRFLSRYRGGDFYTEGLEAAYYDYAMSGQSPEYPAVYIEQTLAGIAFTQQTLSPQIVQSGYNLFNDFPESPIPVYFFAGRHDHETPGDVAEEYYNALEAPAKEFIWFENSAHNIMYDEPDNTNRELIRIANDVLNP